MIGVVIRDLPYLKLLHPICEQFNVLRIPYIIYHWDVNRGNKEYNRASLKNLNKSSPNIIKNAKKIKSFSDDQQLLLQLAQDKIDKLVSVEIWLWAKKQLADLKSLGIATYSILYLTDSLWQPSTSITTMNKVYYSSKYLMESHHQFANIMLNESRDKFLGSPIFDPLVSEPSVGKNILVLLPNLRQEHVKVAFGSSDRFIKIISKIAEGGDLIFKTRKKQWLPPEIKKYAKEIIEDGDIMYPPVVSDLLTQCFCSVMFFSSGIYECVYGGNYVYNITFPLNRWEWEKHKLEKYFSTNAPSVYQFSGVVESLNQDQVIGDWKFGPRRIDPKARCEWIQTFIGRNPAGGAAYIAKDIVSDI